MPLNAEDIWYLSEKKKFDNDILKDIYLAYLTESVELRVNILKQHLDNPLFRTVISSIVRFATDLAMGYKQKSAERIRSVQKILVFMYYVQKFWKDDTIQTSFCNAVDNAAETALILLQIGISSDMSPADIRQLKF